jgi:predicted small lipoprotein YifL
VAVAVVSIFALALTGCGVRGSLEAPQASGTASSPSTTAQADSGQGKKAGDAPKPHQGFILDRLLQ